MEKSRKQMKERRNIAKTIRGVKKVRDFLDHLHSLSHTHLQSMIFSHNVQTKPGDAAKAGKKK